ncbi:hypothetical protein BDR03DRAFT_946481 [Suillus americanus]|nr:hypothetical protein BDR03DRAFT_946481 [Suillus americanus]
MGSRRCQGDRRGAPHEYMILIIVGSTSYWIQHLIFPNRLPTQRNLYDRVAVRFVYPSSGIHLHLGPTSKVWAQSIADTQEFIRAVT